MTKLYQNSGYGYFCPYYTVIYAFIIEIIIIVYNITSGNIFVRVAFLVEIRFIGVIVNVDNINHEM